MPQSTFLTLVNAAGATFRSSLNTLLGAILTKHSGPTAPTVTVPFLEWMDTSVSPPVLRVRNAADNGWATLADLILGTGVVTLGGLSLGAPTILTADGAIGATDDWIINNKAGSTLVVTLPAASAVPGRILFFLNRQGTQISSAASNIVPIGGGSPQAVILPPLAAMFGTLVSDGTNWVLTQRQINPSNIGNLLLYAADAAAARAAIGAGTSTLNVGTPVAMSGQAAVDFTGIGAAANRIQVGFSEISLNGTGLPLLQIGTSSGIENTGYTGVAHTPSNNYVLNSIGWQIGQQSVATNTYSGTAVLQRVTGNTWVCQAMISGGGNFVMQTAGHKVLSGVLDRVRIATSAGAYDAGTVNILWE